MRKCIYAAFPLGLHCLPKYLFRGFQYTKGYIVCEKSLLVIPTINPFYSDKLLEASEIELFDVKLQTRNHPRPLTLNTILFPFSE